MTDTVRLDPSDTVVTAIRPLEVGVAVEEITTNVMIPRGHKVATAPIPKGEAIRKYAQIIGYASEDIPVGAHVHTHNVTFRNTDLDYEFSIGTRNYIAVITSVNCSATAARQIAGAFGPDELAQYPNVDGVTAFVQCGAMHGTPTSLAC